MQMDSNTICGQKWSFHYTCNKQNKNKQHVAPTFLEGHIVFTTRYSQTIPPMNYIAIIGNNWHKKRIYSFVGKDPNKKFALWVITLKRIIILFVVVHFSVTILGQFLHIQHGTDMSTLIQPLIVLSGSKIGLTCLYGYLVQNKSDVQLNSKT